MPSCSRLSYLAARGWLIATVALWVGQVAAQPPERQGVSHPSPAVEGQPKGATQRGYRPPEPPPIPVRIIQSVDEAAHESYREAKSDEHEAKDLAAQQKAADAAYSAAASAYWQEIATFVGIGLTFIGTGLLVWTLRETRRTAKAAIDGVIAAERAAIAAERANKITEDVYLADQRPWLKVDVDIDDALTWHPDNGAQLHFAFRLENVGRSPALNVDIHPDIVLEPTMQYEVDQALLADKARDRNPNGGITIFPGKKDIVRYGLSISLDRIAKGAAAYGGWNDYIHPVLIGCARYRSVYGSACHETGFIYQVRRYMDGRPNTRLGPSEGDIPVDQLVLVEWPHPGRIT